MWWIALILVAGIITGRLLRSRNRLRPGAEKLLLLFIYALLFFLGSEIGSDPAFTSQIKALGFQGALLALLTIAGSIVAWKIIHLFFHEK
ncbi:MAG: LysO family transporter [Bacteroidales bacterium]